MDPRVATNLAMIAQAAAGKTVASFSTRALYAETELRATLDLVYALGLRPRVQRLPLRIAFESGGSIRFIGDEYQRQLEGMRPDVVDGVHLVPVHADIWRAMGVETW